MGLFDSLRKNMPGAPKSVAQHLLKYYLSDIKKFPHSESKDIFKKMLLDRYAVFKGMSPDEINRVLSQTDTLIELTLAVITNENPAAMSFHYRDETIQDILDFFKANAPLEFEKFAMKVQKKEEKESLTNVSGSENIPDRYELKSQIATLIDGCTGEMFNDSHACIVMYKGHRFAWSIVRQKQDVRLKDDVLGKVYLKEVEPEYSVLSVAKKQGLNQKDPGVYMMTDMFAKKCLDILLKGL